MNIGTGEPPRLPDGFAPRMVSFDVFGTLIDTPPANLTAFRAILAEAGRRDLDLDPSVPAPDLMLPGLGALGGLLGGEADVQRSGAS